MMFEIRCDKSTNEVAEIQKIARKYKAYLEVIDEDTEDIWFCMSEICDGDEDQDAV